MRHARLACMLLLYSSAAFAAVDLVEDKNTSSPVAASSSPGLFAALGPSGPYLFSATSLGGNQLWKTDGSALGTTLVADIALGADPGLGIGGIVPLGGFALLAANDGSTGLELWRSDGTAGGTALLADINPGSDGSMFPLFFAMAGVIGSKLYFIANDSTGNALWSSDGTTTTKVPGPCTAQRMGVSGGRVYFVNASQLSVYDPGGGSPHRRDFNAPTVGILAPVDLAGLPAFTSAGKQCVVVDSTSATGYVCDTSGYTVLGAPVRVGATLYVACNLGAGVEALCDSDLASLPGAFTALAVVTGTDHHTVRNLLPFTDGVNSTLIVTLEMQSSPFTYTLGRLDTPAGPLQDIGSVAFDHYSTPVTSSALVLDTAGAGVGQNGVIAYGPSGPSGATGVFSVAPSGEAAINFGKFFFTAPNTALFQAAAADIGAELFQTDGVTYALLDNINPDLTSTQMGLGVASPFGYLFTYGPSGETFSSQGQAATPSTLLAGSANNSPFAPPATFFDGALLYVCNYGGMICALKSDHVATFDWGTVSGHIFDTFYLSPPLKAGSSVYFFADWSNDGGTTFNIDRWRIDATSEPLVAVLDPLTTSGGQTFADLGDNSHALVDGVSDGSTIWLETVDQSGRSDPAFYAISAGTLSALGTLSILDDVFDPSLGGANYLTTLGKLFFLDGGLYMADGAALTTVPLPATVLAVGSELASAGGKLFFAMNAGPDATSVTGVELWSALPDGSAPSQVADIAFGAKSSGVAGLRAAGDKVFFTANDGAHGKELWVYDVQSDTLHMTLDIVPGSKTSGVQLIMPVGPTNHVVFSAADSANGEELWFSDGSAAGTFRLTDVAPGPADSVPAHFGLVGSRLVFNANDGVLGTALYAVDLYPDVAIALSCGVSAAYAGEQITLHIDVTNKGPVPATPRLTLSGPYDVVSIAAPSGCGSAFLPDCDLGSVPANATLSFDATVSRNSLGAGQVTATLTPTLGQFWLPTDDSAQLSIVGNASSDLALSIPTPPPPQALIGDSVSFEVDVHNTGVSPTSVLFSGSATGAFTFQSVSDGTTTCTVSAAAVPSCALGTLAVGATAALQVTGTVDGASVLLQFAAQGALFDPVSTNNSSAVSIAGQQSADLSLAFSTAPPSTVNAGDPVQLVLVVHNAGASPAAVSLSGGVSGPVSLTSVSASNGAACTLSGGMLGSCDLGNIPVGISVTLTLQGVATGIGSALLSFSTASVLPDPNPADNTVSASVSTLASADISIAFDAPPPGTATTGDMLSFSALVKNTGVSATAVTLTGSAAGPLSFQSAVPSNGTSCAASAATVPACALGMLAPGASVSVAFAATVSDAGTVLLTLSAEGALYDPSPANGSLAASIAVSNPASEGSGQTGGSGDSGGGTTGLTVSTNKHSTGCACRGADDGAPALFALFALAAVLARRGRRRTIGTCTSGARSAGT